ncbi:MAG: S9 family peptidase [Verrucomicrobia bacterium]|nr:S9 family peptidase [Verrucomicrobiota bacterium]
MDLRRAFSLLLLVSVVDLAHRVAAETVTPPPPTIEELFGPPLLNQVSLSPDGTRLALIAKSKDDIGNLVIRNLDTNDKPSGLQGDDEIDIGSVTWLGNDHLLFSAVKNKISSQGLYSMPLTRPYSYIPIRLYDAISIVGLPRARPKRAIIWVRQSATDEKHKSDSVQEIDTTRSLDAFKTDARGEKFTSSYDQLFRSVVRLYPDPPSTPIGFEADPDGELAFAYTLDHGHASYARWDLKTETWCPPAPQQAFTSIIAADADRNFAWVVTRDATQGSQLRRMELATGHLDEPVATDANFDLRNAYLIFSHVTHQLVGFSYERQRTAIRWLSPKFAGIQHVIDQALPNDEDHLIVGFDDAENRFIVYSTGPRMPGAYYLFDARTSTLEGIGKTVPTLADRALRSSHPIRFKARDGLPLEGYITLPANASKIHPAPLVVLVHGGPVSRDTWGFDPEAQFLAAQGYAVLKPNYRGSSGYLWPEGSDGYRWAFLSMRNDVIDATRAALTSGLFDPHRVALMGGSFGGYLALACPVEEPDLYCCTVSICGIFDWAELVRSKSDYGSIAAYGRPGEYERLIAKLGDPKKRQADYEALSPLNRLDRLHCPVLIAHGKDDSIVSVKQSRLLASALKEHHLPYETFYRDLAGHGFAAAKDRIAFYQKLQSFLALRLGSASPALP